jgi:hypothetical protein
MRGNQINFQTFFGNRPRLQYPETSAAVFYGQLHRANPVVFFEAFFHGQVDGFSSLPERTYYPELQDRLDE